MPVAASPGRISRRTDADVASVVRVGLERAKTVLQAQAIPVPGLEGKLLRPTIAYALVPAHLRARLDDRFWLGGLAIQMAHEASLLHDDILDEGEERRGRETVYSASGVGAALVVGDQYLTAAYRAALGAGSAVFLERFIVAVERTVAGEALQGRSAGRLLDLETYFAAILGKSGELFGAGACLGASILGLERLDERASLGRQVGALYQQVDDLLDYCSLADTGKPALRDYRQRKWTWVLDVAGVRSWELSEPELLEALFGRTSSEPSAAQRAMVFLETRRKALLRTISELVGEDDLMDPLLTSWLATARAAVDRHTSGGALTNGSESRPARPSTEAVVVEAARRLGDQEGWRRMFRSHARTFSVAARLFPVDERRRIEALYAYCRFTDDLVDDPDDDADPDVLADRLDVWRALSRQAFLAHSFGVPLLDRVMDDAVRAGVDWLYPEALLDGVEMDLRPRRYADWAALGRYTFRVAGAVGGWMSQLFGVGEPALLHRAHTLGHAMQLTNILRDVGEDLKIGRIYLPRVLMDRYELTAGALRTWQRSSGPLPPRYADAMEELTDVADACYAGALPGIRALPPHLRRSVAAAAEAYRGIHREVRLNGFDNLRRRARTSTPRKIHLGLLGVARARPVGRRSRLADRLDGLVT